MCLILFQMIQCIQYRTKSFLNTPEWQSVPWADSPKDVYQKLFDKGFAVADLLREIDDLGSFDARIRIDVLSDYLQRMSDLNTDLDVWFVELTVESPEPLYWIQPPGASSLDTANPPNKGGSEAQPLSPFNFHTLSLATITANYWALRLLLSSTIAMTCGSILSTNSEGRAGALQGIDLKTTAKQLLDRNGAAYRLTLATNIMRAMPYCLSDDMGLIGAQKSLFALRTALFVLRRYPGEHLKWCQAVYQELDNRKGLTYAREIAKLDGKWGGAGRTSERNQPGSPTPGPS